MESKDNELEEAVAEGIEIGKVIGKQTGRREVAEWIDKWWERGMGGKQDWYELEAKLEEWGINNECIRSSNSV